GSRRRPRHWRKGCAGERRRGSRLASHPSRGGLWRAPPGHRRSLSANVWAFAATPSGRDLAHHNVFFASEPNSEFRAIAAGRPPKDPTLYICAQDRGGDDPPPTLDRFEMIANAAPVQTTTPPTEEEKTRCQTRAFMALERMGLTFSPEPELTALTTPPEFAALFPGSEGSLYGLSPEDMNATFKRPTARSAIPGLYLAGGGVHPGPGAPMATLSGLRAAETIGRDLASTSPSRRTVTPGGM
ncbi:MAG: methoxyneurosporene dehydrogenase, partial [Pseudomonadota bacterium]